MRVCVRRPQSSGKADIQRICEQSLGLQQAYRKMQRENEELKAKLQEVERSKMQRQSLIAAVEKAVQARAKESTRPPASWLVYKLSSKIYELKERMAYTTRKAQQVQLSPQIQSIRQRQADSLALATVLGCMGDCAAPASSLAPHFVSLREEVGARQRELIQAERVLRGQEREYRGLLRVLEEKKAKLLAIREMESEYVRVQRMHTEEKRLTEQRMAGNKGYAEELIRVREEQQQRLVALRVKSGLIEVEEERKIGVLQRQLEEAERVRRERTERGEKEEQNLIRQVTARRSERWVKIVSYGTVKPIAMKLIYQLTLRRVGLGQVLGLVLGQEQGLGQIKMMLGSWPFAMRDEGQINLLARYLVEDSGQGLVREDPEQRQRSEIIKSILSNLLSELKTYEEEEVKEMLVKVGQELSKFGKLVQQNLQSRDGNKKIVNQTQMGQALEAAQIFYGQKEINFVLFYLFSWSRNLQKLEVARIFMMNDGEGINWEHRK